MHTRTKWLKERYNNQPGPKVSYNNMVSYMSKGRKLKWFFGTWEPKEEAIKPYQTTIMKELAEKTWLPITLLRTRNSKWINLNLPYQGRWWDRRSKSRMEKIPYLSIKGNVPFEEFKKQCYLYLDRQDISYDISEFFVKIKCNCWKEYSINSIEDYKPTVCECWHTIIEFKL